jgi:hypothetical protein
LLFAGPPRGARKQLRLRFNDAPPFVRRPIPSTMPVGDAVETWRTKLGIAGTPSLHDLDKAQGLKFPDRWRNRVAVNAVVVEVGICDRQSAVVIAAVIRQFDLQAIEHPARRQA